MKLAVCPYCGKKVPYFRSFVIKSKCDYVCPKCKRESKISVDSKMKIPFCIALVISLGFIIFNLAVNGPENILLLAVSILPILIFYLLVPFFIYLKPYLKYKDEVRVMPNKNSKRKSAR